jgi:hypothetical protein
VNHTFVVEVSSAMVGRIEKQGKERFLQVGRHGRI